MLQEVLPEAASCSRQQVRRCAVSALDCHTAVSAAPQAAGRVPWECMAAAGTSLSCASPSEMCRSRRCTHQDELGSAAGTCLPARPERDEVN